MGWVVKETPSVVLEVSLVRWGTLWVDSPRSYDIVKVKELPDDEELVAVDVITEDDIGRVFENDLDESSVISAHNRRVGIKSTAGGSIRDASNSENTSDVEIISEFEWSIVGRLKRNAVDSVSLFTADLSSGALKNDGSAGGYHPVVVRPLWIRSRTACVDLNCGTAGDWAGGFSSGIGVVENAGGCEDWGGETGGDDDVVVLTWLIGDFILPDEGSDEKVTDHEFVRVTCDCNLQTDVTCQTQETASDLLKSTKSLKTICKVVYGDKKRLGQAVKDIDNEIVICDGVNIRSWKLSIDQNPLQPQTQLEQ
ncbi:hypothetical protein LXL04_035742 [Taraxacum kok-saghyz]